MGLSNKVDSLTPFFLLVAYWRILYLYLQYLFFYGTQVFTRKFNSLNDFTVSLLEGEVFQTPIRPSLIIYLSIYHVDIFPVDNF